MKLLDVVTGHWAITPDALIEIQSIYAAHTRREKIDIAAVEARLGRPLASEQQDYELRPGGVAVLKASGFMAPKANLMMQMSGGMSTQMLTKQFDSMAADPRVLSVAFVPDSPGGNVLSVPTAARALANLAAVKPTVTVVEGMAASAMYWVASAAPSIFIDGETDVVGSLGVVQRITWDAPQANEMQLVRGKYKRASVDGNAPSAEYLAQAEGQLDYIYTLLIDTVAQHRGTTSQDVLDRMADGRVFIGRQAITAGLVDGVSTVEAMVEQLATNPKRFMARQTMVAVGALGIPESSRAGDAQTDDLTPTEKGHPMSQALSRESLQRDHADLFQALQKEFFAAGEASAAKAATEAGQKAGADSERERIRAVFAQGKSLPGHQALIEGLAFDGQTTGPEAAVAILQAEASARSKAIADHLADAPKAAPHGHAPDGGAEAAKGTDSKTIAARAVASFNLLRNKPALENAQ